MAACQLCRHLQSSSVADHFESCSTTLPILSALIHPNRLPPLNPNPPAPLFVPLVTLPLPPSWSISIASSSPYALASDPLFPAPLSSLCTSTALSFFLRNFSRSTAPCFTFSTCASKSPSAASHR